MAATAVPQAPAEAGPSAPTSAASLTPALFRRLHPKPYFESFLKEGVRPDGRPAGANAGEEAWRDASVNFGSISTAPASALVRLGNTTVVCGITLEIAPPELRTPTQGFLVPNIDLPPLCSPLFKPGAPSDEAQVLSSRLHDILLASDLVPLSSLLIEPAKAAFVVYLDVVCLNYDGGVLDAAVLACVGALKQLVLPQATWDVDALTATCEPISAATPGRKLPVGPTPLCVSFGIFDSHLLPDPTLFETDLCSSHLTIALSDSTALHAIYQAGAFVGPGEDQLKACLSVARSRAKTLEKLLQQ